jgi:phosphoglycolate phosphatase-like HAD superfamily hydrolase
MQRDTASPLECFPKRHAYFIGIDSDGCAFDTMEIKHKECFIPNIIKHFGLQAIARMTRDAAEFVNLYSRWRGINRFPALLRTMNLLVERDEVRTRGFAVPRLPALHAWLECEHHPSNPALAAASEASAGTAADELNRVLAWSRAVNASIADLVQGVPPFPSVRPCLETAAARADIMVISATPGEALEREWREHDLARFVALIASQELGSKTRHLQAAAAQGYAPEHMLMIGDAPGDLAAARANHALFFPICPGAEEQSWRRLCEDGLRRFFDGTFAGEYQARLISGFEQRLPELPPWKAGTSVCE